jgi:hypothetical protein
MSVFLASTQPASGSVGSTAPGHPRGWRWWIAACACLTLAGATALQTTTAQALPDDEAEWVAFIDTNGAAGDLTVPEALKLTSPTGSGTLKRIADGTAIVGVQVTGSTTGTVTKSGSSAEVAEGTDASEVFGGVVDLAGLLVISPGSSTELSFSGLDPGRSYTLVTTANRNRPGYESRLTTFALLGADDWTNTSSTGTQASVDGSAITFSSGYNTLTGYVARWTGIEPGDDGEIQLASTVDAAAEEAFGAGAVMLALEPVDTTPPTITLLGDADLTIPVGGTFTDPGATASDNVDGDITNKIVATGTVNTSTVGTYHLTYDVTDAAGNHATQVTRTVQVADATKPVITLLGDADLTIPVDGTFTDPGATASDNVDGDITDDIVVGGTVNTAAVGLYQLTYDVTDAAGNHAIQLTRTVHVVLQVLTSTPTPTIGGDPVVGVDLTAQPGPWEPVPVEFAYQWYRGDQPITGATKAIYRVVPDDRGFGLSVEVIGSKDGYADVSRLSAQTTAVPEFVSLTKTPAPTVTGKAQVGRTLTAKPGTWKPAPVALAYQWLRDGVPIPDAIAVGYRLTAADLGHRLAVEVTGSSVGYEPVAKKSKLTAKVKAAVLTTTPKPLLKGKARVGVMLTVNPRTWGPGVVNLRYRWYRNSKLIKEAEASTYTLVAADKGKRIKVKVTGSRDGYTSVTRTSARTHKVAAGTLTAPATPEIVGDAMVGAVLTVDPGIWTPTPDEVTTRWLRSGKLIKGVSGGTYTVTAADLGKRISARVTASKSGYRTGTQTTAKTVAVITGT